MKEVERHSVTGYGRQDINYNDPEGEFVYYEDYAALQQQLSATTNSITNAQEALKSAGVEADTVQAGVMELVSRMNQVVEENALMLTDYRDIPEMRRIGAPLTPATDAYLNAVRADTERMNYLAGKVVNVRTPLPYGSHNIFWSQCITDDSDPSYETDLREQIDAQLRAGNAGKDGSHE